MPLVKLPSAYTVAGEAAQGFAQGTGWRAAQQEKMRQRELQLLKQYSEMLKLGYSPEDLSGMAVFDPVTSQFDKLPEKPPKEEKLTWQEKQYRLWATERLAEGKDASMSAFMLLGKDPRTPLQKNIPTVAKMLGIPEKEATKILTQRKDETPRDFFAKVLRLAYQNEGDALAATKVANNIFETVYGEPYITQQGLPSFDDETVAPSPIESKLKGMKAGKYGDPTTGMIIEWNGEAITGVRKPIIDQPPPLK